MQRQLAYLIWMNVETVPTEPDFNWQAICPLRPEKRGTKRSLRNPGHFAVDFVEAVRYLDGRHFFTAIQIYARHAKTKTSINLAD
jgi:hypothetical protein